MKSKTLSYSKPACGRRGFFNRMILSVYLMCAGLLAACAGGTLQQHDPAALTVSSSWPQALSDLAVDPQTLFGRLPNGIGYVLKENKTPLDRVSMHLFIRSGSLNEYENEQGMAHFLEHMLFNGSEHFPPGEMVKFFQRIGMQFGPDANAHTSFAQTVYDVILPKGDPRSLGEGLLVLKDYAEGALLLQEELERERKVILAEKRSRDSAEFRIFKSVLEFEAPGTLLSERLPIGEEAVLKDIDAEMMRAYYDAWYRPERMTVVMVGDFDTTEALGLLKHQFGSLRPRSAKRDLPNFGHFEHKGLKAFYHHENEVGGTKVSIESVVQNRQPADSIQYRKQTLLEDLGDAILQFRLNKLLQQADSVLVSASIASGHYLQEIRFAEISADTRPANWRQTLRVLENELRKALTHGFTESELTRVKKETTAQLLRDVEESNTRDSNALARRIMADLNARRVHQSPRQRLALFESMLADATLEKVNEHFRNSWAADHRLVIITGNADLAKEGRDPQEVILSAYNDSRSVAVQAPVESEPAHFPYLPVPEQSASIVSRESMPMGIEQVTFASGLTLLLKPTAFRDNEVKIAMSFGGGQSSQPLDQPGLAEMTSEVINNSGFGQLDRYELEEALAGRTASISLDVREDMFVVKGDAVSKELPVLFQLLYAFINDPGYRREARELALKRYRQHYQSLMADIDGVMQVKGQRFLAGGDTRFGMPSWDEYEQRTMDQVQEWFGGQMRRSPLEVSVVGDFDVVTAIELAARYFGDLSPRSLEKTEAAPALPDFPRGDAEQLNAASVIPKSLLVVAYPTDDFWDIQQTRRLSVLADVLSERLRERIREALGAAYSPFAYNRSFRSYPGFGVLQIHLNVDPESVAMLEDEVQQIVRRLAQQGIDPDEFHRVLDPTLTNIKDLRQTNSYWLNSVLTGASRHPQQLAWSQTMEQDYASITIADITALAERFLIPAESAVIVVAPHTVLPAQSVSPSDVEQSGPLE